MNLRLLLARACPARMASLLRWCRWGMVAVGGLAAAGSRAAEEPPGARVLILANRNDPDSGRIAHHYAEVRGVPAENVLALPMPVTEAIPWREFVATIWQPLLDHLVPAGWIEAIPMEATDPVGRRKYAPHRHRIAALVVCRGVPLKIEHDPALYAEVRPFTARGEFRTNAGAVDSELSLLALPNYPINAFVPNPLHQNPRPSAPELAQVVRVARLDGLTAEEANTLVDRAVGAERTGLIGRAYVDLANRDALGDGWLEATARQLNDLGFDLTVDRENHTLPATGRIDAPALYFGWYAGAADGPFLLPGFRFAPGAIALHIHSYSASTLRQPGSGWVGPLVARGVTATVGNVHEPYLAFTHAPHLLLRALARGATLAEAAYEALPALSWQAILIGDPLYRPFAVSLEQQLARRADLPPRLTPYAALRQMRLLDAAGRREEAAALGAATQREVPSLALAVALARRGLDAGEREAAGNTLGFVPLLSSFDANEWALAREAALLLETAGRPNRAVGVWRTLLGTTTLPVALRLAWLPEALRTASLAGDAAQARAWEKDLASLTSPPPVK
ncbi:MAG: TIGR03790 family protein [Verrucomicrobia bacterium]|nr:TIGR03790 family protein [Verrucomicrobiota bacterium]